MSEELQKPPVIDFDALMQPISEENPSGENLRYSGLYDEINEARRADDDLNLGEWQTQLKTADYRRVIELAIPALTSQTKDIQIAAWLSEALVREYGFVGLRDSLRIITAFQDTFWDSLHPEIDEGDMEGRGNAIEWMDVQGSMAIKTAPITSGKGLSYIDFEDSRIFDIPDDLSALEPEEQQRYNELKERAEKENRSTAEMWRQAVKQTRRQFCEETNFVIEECWEAYKDLNRVIEEKFDRNQAPGLNNLRKILDDIHSQVKKILEKRRIEEPYESELETDEYVDGSGETVSRGGGTGGSSGPVQSRSEALRRLAEVAAYFQRTEPHSPVSYLVQRAVKWGNMPLESWLMDVIKDDGVLGQIRQTLGLDTSSSGWGESGYNYEETSTETTTEASDDSW
jgi:type VI secretion system protein ImpA